MYFRLQRKRKIMQAKHQPQEQKAKKLTRIENGQIF